MISITKEELNNLYVHAYTRGHNDTVEGQYVDILMDDYDTYFNDEIEEWLGEV